MKSWEPGFERKDELGDVWVVCLASQVDPKWVELCRGALWQKGGHIGGRWVEKSHDWPRSETRGGAFDYSSHVINGTLDQYTVCIPQKYVMAQTNELGEISP